MNRPKTVIDEDQWSLIDKELFEQLVRGGSVVGVDDGGTTFRCRDGRLVAMTYDGSTWSYSLLLGKVV